jgi:hypothetical protein
MSCYDPLASWIRISGNRLQSGHTASQWGLMTASQWGLMHVSLECDGALAILEVNILSDVSGYGVIENIGLFRFHLGDAELDIAERAVLNELDPDPPFFVLVQLALVNQGVFNTLELLDAL